ncbi:MAG: putative quinol monooxygenase [Parvibaculaceae bacterium]
MVHRRAISPRVEIQTLRPASALQQLHRRCSHAKPFGLIVTEYTTLITFQIQPERMAEFEAMMAVEAPLTRGFEGCKLFEIYASTSVRGEVIFLERWKSEHHSQAYGRWRTERGDMDRLGAFFSAPPTTVVLSRIAEASTSAQA